MNTMLSLENARDLALQKVGRNLVSLQKLEGMLKHLLATVHLEGDLNSLAEKATRRSEKVSRMTMGQVIRELAAALFDDCGVSQDRLELSSEPWISSKFTIEGGPDAARLWKLEMSAILEARNRLVYHMLVGFDPNSIESCVALSSALDSQREQLISVYEHVRSLVIASKEALEELSRAGQSVDH